MVAVRKNLTIRRERVDAAVRAVRGDEQRVEPKELRNFRLVVRQVLVERRARGYTGLLQLDDRQRQAVDEADWGKSKVRIPNSEVKSLRQSKFAIRHFPRTQVTLN
jgi:hypothetical protein